MSRDTHQHQPGKKHHKTPHAGWCQYRKHQQDLVKLNETEKQEEENQFWLVYTWAVSLGLYSLAWTHRSISLGQLKRVPSWVSSFGLQGFQFSVKPVGVTRYPKYQGCIIWTFKEPQHPNAHRSFRHRWPHENQFMGPVLKNASDSYVPGCSQKFWKSWKETLKWESLRLQTYPGSFGKLALPHKLANSMPAAT